LVVVVRDRSPLWAVIAAILLVLVAVAILIFIITGGRGTVFVIAVPGFPPESIAIGLLLGVLLVVLKRKPAKAKQKDQRTS
jgi:membrane protein implicated in regulation of membrane protease activity